MLQVNRRIITNFDFLIPILVIPIIMISNFLISEANETLANKQLVYFAIGFFVFLLFFLLPVKKLEWLIPFFYWIGIILLISVYVIGSHRLGSQRWIELPFVHFTIQPSEVFKPAFLLMMCYLVRQSPPPRNGYNFKRFIIISAHILLPFFIILFQPDLGTALTLLLVGFGILFAVGINKKIWIILFVLTALASPVIYNSLHDYQKQRILDFIGDKPSYQVEQSIIAIGSGGYTGKIQEEATQTHFRFLPIATSDFIFAYLIERGGFFGGLTLMILYSVLIIHLITMFVAFKGDYFTQTMTIGIAFLLFIYTGVNIAMNVGFAPVVGIPLPFFSYGGSSFITFMALFGIYENLMAFRFDALHESIKYSANPVNKRFFKKR